MLLPENYGNKDIAVEKSSKSPEGAATGAASGAVVGGALGWLVGIGVLAIPGLGPFIAAGPIMAALSGPRRGRDSRAASPARWSASGSRSSKRNDSKVVLRAAASFCRSTATTTNGAKKAKVILGNTGAEDISSTGEASADYGSTDKPVPRYSSQPQPPTR